MGLVHQFIVNHTNSKLDDAGKQRFGAISDGAFLDGVLADFGLPPIPRPGGGALLKYLIVNRAALLALAAQLVALFSALGV